MFIDSLSGHHQLLVVTTQDWDAKQGELVLYERATENAEWMLVEEPIPVVLGTNGLAWGIGLHPMDAKMPCKQEGDGKSPAGIFSLGTAFGFAPCSEMGQLKIAYLPLHASIAAIDDPLSCYYNCIIDRRTVTPDWHSSEKMGEEPLYAMGLEIQHNFPTPKAHAGSAIFFHIWREENLGTAGCTAMHQEDLKQVLFWLDSSKNPLLVQLPLPQYRLLEKEWNLPPLKESVARRHTQHPPQFAKGKRDPDISF